jgi:glycosyltransferase A (GT-A) superfamily protein (DUF2064 family)
VSAPTLLVLAKAPRPGYSKTRLAPLFGERGAAVLAAAALADTLDAVAAAPAARRVLVLDGVLAGAGPLAVRLPRGVEVAAQTGGSHAARIAAAFELADGPALLVGMDTPQVTPADLTLDGLGDGGAEAALGPAEDGGWWAMLLPRPRQQARLVLGGVPMSTARTGELQHRALEAAGLRVRPLPRLRDVDEPADALAVAALAPQTRFAAVVAAAAGATLAVAEFATHAG